MFFQSLLRGDLHACRQHHVRRGRAATINQTPPRPCDDRPRFDLLEQGTVAHHSATDRPDVDPVSVDRCPHNEIVATFPKISEAMAHRDRLDPAFHYAKKYEAEMLTDHFAMAPIATRES
jgi:hypothetical protein